MSSKKKPEEAEPEWVESKIWFTLHVPVALRSTATYQWGSNIETMAGAEYLIEHCVTPEKIRHRCVIIEHCERTRRHKTKYKKKRGKTKSG